MAAVFLVISVLSATAEPIIDGSSQQSFEASLQNMTAELSESEKDQFGRGLINIILSEYPPARGLKGLARLTMLEAATKAAPTMLDGVPMSEIMARGITGGSVADESNVGENEKNTRLTCIREKVLVTGARFIVGDISSTVEFDVRNNLEWAIAGIRLIYAVREDGRSVPWAEERVVMGIDGGVEPGEVRTIRTSAFVSRDVEGELNVVAEILDVADPAKRLFIAETGVMGWPDEQSLMECKS